MSVAGAGGAAQIAEGAKALPVSGGFSCACQAKALSQLGKVRTGAAHSLPAATDTRSLKLRDRVRAREPFPHGQSRGALLAVVTYPLAVLVVSV